METTKTPEYKWRLTWSGYQDTLRLRKCVEYLKIVTLWKHSDAHLIGHEEYLQLIKDGLIAPARSYWQIGKGEVGVISLDSYKSFSTTWDSVATAKTDFMSGYYEGVKDGIALGIAQHKVYLKDEIEAWKEHKDRKKQLSCPMCNDYHLAAGNVCYEQIDSLCSNHKKEVMPLYHR
jgi:hypothetical protein